MPNYPVPYQNNWGYNYSGNVGQQVYPQYQGQSMMQQPQQVQSGTQSPGYGLIWVDGEVGAKAFQMPAGWPAGQPIALWDTNDTCIYLKSTNPMGMPNPLQKAHYTLEGMKSGERTQGFSGTAEQKPDMSEYVKKEDLDKMKQDLIDTIGSMNTSGTGVRRNTKGDS